MSRSHRDPGVGMGGTHADSRRSPFDGTFWAMLAPLERELVLQAGAVRRFEPGESLGRQGDSSQHVYVLLVGSIEIVTDVSTGYEGVLAVRGSGDVVGELAAVDGRPRSATMRALERVEAIVVPSERFAALCRSRPELSWVLLHVVVGRLRELSRQRADDGGRPVAQRLAVLLIELAGRYGVAVGETVMIAIPITQKSMAGLISASRESVVRALAELRRQRLIATARRRVTILRLDALEELAS
ncbi:Crp/Fnr family transcriptional regulator [Saccharopolyspora sp. WRP15-2]|uniref:Crp/Fnr family transcriptional regulator n=1 Tax=Saccharopolyspora oryzae TaxID=2997343 RepID=A0ABT4UY01_9PSEU|nr:Crp/Fnr family transcriptional regulator [Saccharopolyspora oryzae]MDA3626587.1 Crp/Fnr family transcriptional regulator [Saccharopolyspora oryzae]